ncbi:MAG: hypothetical protein L6416_04355 [Candidatus Omnitrophica bacterium]|nr:hypothetical protein [Candidatus Omnitrophota bacterium]
MKQICNNILAFSLLCTVAAAGAWASVRDFTYEDKGNRDPFISLVTQDGRILPGAKTASDSENIELEGIIWDPRGNSMAIINGKLVKEKERIMDMQVLIIKKASVILQKEGKVMVINLKKGGGNSDGQ